MRVCSSCGRCFEDAVGFCVEPGHPPLPDPAGLSIEAIEGYRLEQVVRSNRNCADYRAQHLESGRFCVIRTIRADEAVGQQFIKEANLASGLYLSTVANVYDSGQIDAGEYFVVWEDGDGQTVRALLNSVGVPQLLTTIQIVRQAAEALYAIHQKGLVHGAIRPENILLSRDAEDRLLVKIHGLDLAGVEHRSIIGNKFLIDQLVQYIRYFSPEQCGGEEVTFKSDIYSLGVVLYELLAGAPPFEASTAAALIGMHKSKRPADVRIDNFDLRMLLTHTLMESLSKHPDRRQSSANAFARQMRHIEQLATHVSTPPPVVSTSASTANRFAAPENVPVLTLNSGEPLEADSMWPEVYEIGEPNAAANQDRTTETYVHIPAVDESEADLQGLGPVAAIEGPDELRGPASQATELAEQRAAATPVPTSRLRSLRRKLHSLVTEAPPRAASPEIEQKGSTDETLTAPQSPESLESLPPVDEDVPAKPIRRESTRIEWEQPEDDIPSVDDVMEVLAQEQTGDPPNVSPDEAPKVNVHPGATSPARQASVIDAAQKTAAKKKTTAEGKSQPSPVRRKQVPRSVTAVSKSPQRVRPVSSYYPTLLGGVDDKAEYRTPSESIFAAYDSESGSGMKVPVRPIVVGAGMLAIISFFLFGEGPIGRYLTAGQDVDSVAAKSESVARPESSDAALPPATVTAKSEEPLPEPKKADAKEPRTVARDSTPPVRDSKKRAVPERNKKEAAPEKKVKPTQPASKREAPLPPIIVGKPKIIIRDEVETRVKTQTNRSSGTIRPRIVKEPK